ncbi:MAG: endonuclease/exonuclease/phosphatase family protein [Turicibacter sp.]|nr:endonuclease/exonuclease/phosphatase family protein [Turicibacter sp.]
MRIMTFNLRSDFIFDGKNRWKNRKHIVHEILNHYACDIIGLQEVTTRMRHDLEGMLEDYQIVGEARSKKLFVEHNNLLISKRYKIIEEETFWLSNTPQKVGSSIWYSIFPRICTTVKVELEGGTVIRIYNTHLDCYLSPARKYGLKKIMRYIAKQHELEHIPVVLALMHISEPTRGLRI